MNLSPGWTEAPGREGFQAIHWSAIGDPRATDESILAWAHSHDHVLLTNDLDFGTILAASRASSPSVLQLRAQDVSPAHLSAVLVAALRRDADHLPRGALISVDEASHAPAFFRLANDHRPFFSRSAASPTGLPECTTQPAIVALVYNVDLTLLSPWLETVSTLS